MEYCEEADLTTVKFGLGSPAFEYLKELSGIQALFSATFHIILVAGIQEMW